MKLELLLAIIALLSIVLNIVYYFKITSFKRQVTSRDFYIANLENEADRNVLELSEMTIKELKDYAKQEGISLKGNRKKSEIIKVIENA